MSDQHPPQAERADRVGTAAEPAPGAQAEPAPGAQAEPAGGAQAEPAPGAQAEPAPGAPAPGAPGAPAEPAEPAPSDDDLLTDDERIVRDQLAREVTGGSDADLWAFELDGPLRAQEALLAAMRMVGRKQLTLEDAAIVTKVRGRVRITQTRDVSPGQGAMSGAWLGVLAGLFLGPGGPLLGGALGAAAGGLFGKLRDYGIDDDQMKRMGDELPEGRAALFLLVADCHRMRALHEVGRFPAKLLATTASPELAEEVSSRFATDPWDVV